MPTDLTPLTTQQSKALKTKNVSDSIRYLDTEGFDRAEIARILGKRYQHVRNVLVRSTESGVRRKTLGFNAHAKTIEDFRAHCKKLGRRPERYLNQLLSQGLQELAKKEPNSLETERQLIELYENDFRCSQEVKLESPLVEEIQEECEKMHVPINFFIAATMEAANCAVTRALELANGPFEFAKNSGLDPLANYVMNDQGLQDLLECREDDMRLVAAVVEIKDCSISSADMSVSNLSRVEKDKLKMNPGISEIMDRIKEKEKLPVNLDDLL